MNTTSERYTAEHCTHGSAGDDAACQDCIQRWNEERQSEASKKFTPGYLRKAADELANDLDGDGEYSQMLRYAATRITTIESALAECRRDAERLDWLEKTVKGAYLYGISFDHVPSLEGDPSGYRLMRRGYISEPQKTIRKTIDAAIARSETNDDAK